MLGLFYIGQEKQSSKAIFYLDKACSYGLGDMCGFLGGVYVAGVLVEGSAERAKSLFKKGCKLSSSYACMHLGHFFYHMKEYEQALTFYRVSCSMKDSCTDNGCRASSQISCNNIKKAQKRLE